MSEDVSVVLVEESAVLVHERDVEPALIATESRSVVIAREDRPQVLVREQVSVLMLAGGNQGPPGVDGADGIGASNDLEIPFAFGDATPKLLGSITGVVIATSLVLTDAFNGTGSLLSVGTMADPELLMAADANLAGEVGRFESNPAVRLDDDDVFLFITPGLGATQGAGVVFLEIAE